MNPVVEILMPRLQPGVYDGEILCWFKRAGQLVRPGESIAEIREGSQVTTIRAFDHGVVLEVLAQEGSQIGVGDVVARLQFNGTGGRLEEFLQEQDSWQTERGVQPLDWDPGGDQEDPDPFFGDPEKYPESFGEG